MDIDNKTSTNIPTIRLKAIGDSRVATFNIPIGAILKVDDIEVI